MSDETPGDGTPGDGMPGDGAPDADAPGWAAPTPVPPPGSGAPVPGAPAPAAPPAPATSAWTVPPTPAAAMSSGAAPRKRRGWIVVLVLALVAIVAIGIAGTVLFVTRTLPPYQGAYDFLDDVNAGREQAAIAGLCAAGRDDPQAAFGELARRINTGDTVTVNFLSVDRDGGRATVEYVVDPPGTTVGRTYDLLVVEEDGDWKACPGQSLR